MLALLVSALLGTVAALPATDVTIGPTFPTSAFVRSQLLVADDPDGTLSLAAVRAQPARFEPAATAGKPRRLPHRYWLRFGLTNAFDRDTRIALIADSWDEADYSVIDSTGGITTLVSGLRRPIVDPHNYFREPHPFDVFPEAERARASAYSTFTLRPGEHVTVYVHVATSRFYLNPTFAVLVARFDDFLERGRYRLYGDGIIIGFLVGLALYSLVIGISRRDRSYGWYALYLVVTATSLAGLLGPGTSNLAKFILPEHPFAALILKRLTEPLAWSALVMFTRDFYQTRQRWRSLDWALLATAAVIVLDFVAYSLGWRSVSDQWIWIVAVLLSLATGIVAYANNVKSPYFIAGQLVVLLGLFETTITQSGWDPAQSLPDGGVIAFLKGSTSVYIAAACNALIFSLALSDRFRRDARDQQLLLEATVDEQTRELRAERDTSEMLLRNILPVSVAAQLKRDGVAEAKRFDDVTILFTDFKDFTTISGLMPPKKVVEELDELFRAFDDIVEARGLEKIKTIGDAYMAAAGVPEPCADHAQRCVATALEMMAFVAERNRRTAVKWEMRAGIHSGTVVAGVVGKRKFTYDIWGDTVNIAARVEASGEPGRVNVSAYTFDLAKDDFAFGYRGKVEIKGKGEIDMYLVESPVPAAGIGQRDVSSGAVE